MINVAILGASGYTGSELIRLLSGHPYFKIVALSADRKAGKEYYFELAVVKLINILIKNNLKVAEFHFSYSALMQELVLCL